MKHVVYVYGTLRPGTGPTIQIPGVMYDLGWFPGVILPGTKGLDDGTYTEGSTFTAERIEVSDERLKGLDRYEGYDPGRPEISLYIRRPYLDGWVYEYNDTVHSRPVIESGDWLEYTKEKSGRNSALLTER